MAHDIWKDNIKLMLNGCHNCWSYKAITFAFDAKLIDFNPDIINTLYEKRYINFVGICPKTAPSQGYNICNYINWVGMHGK